MEKSFLNSALKQFEYYKSLGDKTLTQLSVDQIFWSSDVHGNSVAVLMKHLGGNMLSRWTNFLTEDGEKEWRNRDDEFEDSFETKEGAIAYWENGWNCLFTAIKMLTHDKLEDVIYIRNQGHTVTEAINRQLCHYPYHVGQIVFLGKMILGDNWQTLSIAKNASKDYNTEKFASDKVRKHFTEDL